MKVVLAERDAGMRAFMRPMFKGRVTRLVEVTNIWDCLAFVIATAPDVALIGTVDGCEESGRELPAVLRHVSPTTHVLVLGARAPRGLEASSPDVDAFLPYPFRTERLLSEISRVVGLRTS